MPVALNTTGRESGTIPPTTVTMAAMLPGALQAWVPYTVYVTLPLGWNPPVRSDESVTLLPTAMLSVERDVERVRLILPTATCSHVRLAPISFAFPRYAPSTLYLHGARDVRLR